MFRSTTFMSSSTDEICWQHFQKNWAKLYQNLDYPVSMFWSMGSLLVMENTGSTLRITDIL